MILRAHPIRENPCQIVPAPKHRLWLDAIPNGHPYRCLPLSIGSEYGWQLVCERDVVALWHGLSNRESLTVDGGELAASHFGYGIVTFFPGYIFRTPPGWDMYVTGPANEIKIGAQPLQAVIETDWGGHTWSFNWKITQPFRRIVFDQGEPFCQFWPVKRGALEKWKPIIEPAPPELREKHTAWARSRIEHLNQDDEGWEKGYYRGDGAPESHQMRLNLKPFEVKIDA